MRKAVIITAVALGLFLAFGKKITGATTDATEPASGNKTRQQMIDELFNLHQTDSQNFAGRGLKKDIYDQFNDDEIRQIYLVDTYQTQVTPAFVDMLKKHGWA